MNSDHDITLRSEDNSSNDAAKSRFLDAFGLGGDPLRDAADTVPGDTNPEARTEDGVILSSQPDDIGIPAASPQNSKARAISISIDRGAGTSRAAEVIVPDARHSDAPCAAAMPSGGERLSAPEGSDSVLRLNCPECDGELVLMRRHVGIEGACVWCHTPIVAAESARDGQVRVFPILDRTKASAPAEAQTSAESHTEVAGKMAEEQGGEGLGDAVEGKDEVPAPASEAASMPGLSNPVATAPPESFPSSAADAEQAPLPTGFAAFSDSSPGQDPSNAAPASEASFGNEPQGPVFRPCEGGELVSPTDLETLYGESSSPARQVSLTPRSVPGFGETLAGPPEENDAEAPSIGGFGTFLSTPAPAAPLVGNAFGEGFVESPALSDDAPEAVGFSAAAPWGTSVGTPFPKPASDSESPKDHADEPPTVIPAGFASGFVDAPSMEETAPTFAASQPAAPWASPFEGVNSMAENSNPSASSGIGEEASATVSESAFPGSFGSFFSSEPVGGRDEASSDTGKNALGTTFPRDAAPSILFGTSSERSADSFSLPGNEFATGSSPEVPSPSSSFPELGRGAESSWGISEPIGGSADTGPATIFSDAAEPQETSAPHSLFGEPSFLEAPAAEAFGFGQDASPVETGAPISKPTPIFSPVEETAPAVAATQPEAPTVPGAAPALSPHKPKPAVRKGFLLLMVIILGFASGAALASFVLPVDSYVQKARAFMEEKFNPGGLVQQVPLTPQISQSHPSPAEENAAP